ncbi:MAG: N-acetyltransferase family protein [Anaerolineales bacterium]
MTKLPNGIIIRQAKQMDMPQILELWKELMDFHSARDSHFVRAEDGHEQYGEFISECIDDRQACVWVAEQKRAGKLVAHCLAMIAEYPPVFVHRRYGMIYDLAVTASCRRRGIGQALVDKVIAWFAKRDIHRIEVQFTTTNEVSNAFWVEKTGFQPFLIRAHKTIQETDAKK